MRSVPIGVVILNWNGHADTIACLESLVAADPAPARVVVVDNASTDDSVAVLTRWAGRAQLHPTMVRSGHNRGFAGGNNLGLEVLARDVAITHSLLLNNDATVEPDFFGEVAAALERSPSAGLLGVTIYEGPGRERVWYAGGRLPNARAVVIHGTHVPPATSGTAVPTQFVTGCAPRVLFPVLRGCRVLVARRRGGLSDRLRPARRGPSPLRRDGAAGAPPPQRVLDRLFAGAVRAPQPSRACAVAHPRVPRPRPAGARRDRAAARPAQARVGRAERYDRRLTGDTA